MAIHEWDASGLRNPGGVALDAGEGRGDRVGRHKEDSEDGGRGVQQL